MPTKHKLKEPLSLTRVYTWFSALVANDTALMDDLLLHGLPIDVPHPLHHTTALMEATRLGRTASVHWLLARGAAPAFLCGRPRTSPLHIALLRHYWEVASLHLAFLGSAALLDGYGRTPLHIMCLEAPDDTSLPALLPLADTLIGKGCQLDALDHEGITALHYCVINDHAPLAHLLLDRGANPNMLTPDTKVSPLTIAALEKNVTLATLLLQFGADPHIPTHDGTTAAHIMPGIEQLATSMDAQKTEVRSGRLHEHRPHA